MTTRPREAGAPRSARRATLSFAIFSLLPAVVSFACAGALRWGSGWLYVVTLWIVTVGG